MDKSRVKIIITGILIVFLVLAWVNAIEVLKKSSKKKRPKNIPSLSISITYPASTAPSVRKREWTEDKELSWKRCPFSGISYSQETSEDLEVSGIMWDETKPQTIINGQILGEGDTIGAFRIEKIEKQKVILSDGTKTVELSI